MGEANSFAVPELTMIIYDEADPPSADRLVVALKEAAKFYRSRNRLEVQPLRMGAGDLHLIRRHAEIEGHLDEFDAWFERELAAGRWVKYPQDLLYPSKPPAPAAGTPNRAQRRSAARRAR